MKNANPVSGGWWRLAWLLALVPGLAGCARPATDKAGAVKTVEDYFTITVDSHPVRMQLAVLPVEMAHGLMERRHLGQDEGMLFVFQSPRQLSFWMHDTLLPLSVGYYDATGVLREVYPMYPLDETPVNSHGNRLQLALEMNQGWFAANGVRAGSSLDLPAVQAALRARGFDPAAFGWK